MVGLTQHMKEGKKENTTFISIVEIVLMSDQSISVSLEVSPFFNANIQTKD